MQQEGDAPGAVGVNPSSPCTVYRASAVAWGDRAILITGPSGIGKSELALMLIDRGATLVSDDQVALTPLEDRLYAGPAPNIAGMLEVRNLGIRPFPHRSAVRVALSLLLDPSAPRWVECSTNRAICGVAIPEIRLDPESRVLAIKAEMALQAYGLPL